MDLSLYAKSKLAAYKFLHGDRKTNIAKGLILNCEKNFLVLALALDILKQEKDVFKKEKVFEAKLNELLADKLTSPNLYERVWTKLGNQDNVKLLLGIMLALKRPMTYFGLQEFMDG
ncbi:hypothetical protein HDU99_003954, partial [Rhizoclosmatium hyalinum]